MVDFSVAYDKLANFETAQEIREYFQDRGLKGITCKSMQCPIAVFFQEETGKEDVLVDPTYILRLGNHLGGYGPSKFDVTTAMAEFIILFDDFNYPELISDLDPEHPDYENLVTEFDEF